MNEFFLIKDVNEARVHDRCPVLRQILYSSHSGFYENLPWFSPLRGRFARPNWVLPICQGCSQHDSSSSHINPYAPVTHRVDAYLKFLTAVSIDLNDLVLKNFAV